jgi:hypothetical protein
MGGSISLVSTRGRRATHTLIAAALALVLLALLAGTAAAQSAGTHVAAAGMTTPAGVAITPDGGVWVSDALYGLCHVTPTGLDRDELCAPEAQEDEAEVPEGTPQPPAPPATRPAGTGQIAFDAVTSNFYVAEGTSGSSGVWRMHWNADSHKIDKADKIFTSLTRVQGLAVTGSGAVVFSDKETSAIRRLDDPASITEPLTVAPNAGFSVSSGSSSLATLGEAVYIADGGSLTKIDPTGSGLAVPLTGQPAPIEDFEGAMAAVASDPARGVVYGGTATPELTDAVFSFTDDVRSDAAYDRGYTNIMAMTVAPDGALYILQDPNGALSPSTDPTGQAELYRKPLGPLVAPEAVLAAKPRAATRDASPSFAFKALNGADPTRFECRLDGELVACAVDGTTGSYEAMDLAEGRHTFAVRATNVPDATADDWGPTTTYGFRVDRTAPTVSIDDPSSHTAPGGKLRLYFSADQAGVGFVCKVDDEPAAQCDPPRDFTLAEGEHTIAVRATDDAGNTSAAVMWDVTATPAPKPATPPATTIGIADPAPTPVVPTPVTPQPRVPRIEIGVPCVEVSASRAAARFSLQGRNAIVRFRAPAAARYAKFTLRRAGAGRRRASVVETLAYARVSRAGAADTTRIALTRGQRRLVRSGATRLAVAYGTCRTQVGQFQWITSSIEGNR